MLANYPTIRKWTYVALWVIGLLLTVAQIWVASTDAGQPKWLTGCLAVFPAVAAYVGYQAQSNVQTKDG